MIFDAEKIRSDFPALHTLMHGKPLIYLDNAATAHKPRAVLEALQSLYVHTYANVHRGTYELAVAATEAFEQARTRVAQFLNAERSSEIIVTSGATGALNLAAATLGTQLHPGDEIILSPAEHHSNFVPWHFLRRQRGVTLRFVELDADGGINPAAVLSLVNERTRIITLTHVSNVTGGSTDWAAITAGIQGRGIITVADGAQGAVHAAPDVQALGVDAYALTGHKLGAASGAGALYLRHEVAQSLPPFLGGGEMIDTVTLEHVTYAEPPHRFEAGTPPIVPFITMQTAIDYWQARLGAHEHVSEVHRHAEECLRAAVPGVRILGNAPNKAPVTTFVLPGVHALDAAVFADLQGLALRCGKHCAEPLAAHFGVEATLRASFAPYNTKAEAERLAEIMAAACKRLRS